MEKGIKAYHSYLSFGDAKEALSETVCEDLNLDDLCEQLDYTSSCVGRQYLYHIYVPIRFPMLPRMNNS